MCQMRKYSLYNPPMIPVQPTKLAKYLSTKTTQPSQSSYRTYYVSFEDALWDLIKIMKVTPGSKILLPEFFCGDVVTNMTTHHLRPVYYPKNLHLQTSIHQFKQKLIEEKPAIVIIFHPVGMTNRLLKHYKKWHNHLPKKCLIIEDCVHRVVNPNAITFINKHHFIIDSLRKVVPLPGSYLYSPTKLPQPANPQTIPRSYKYQVLAWWTVFQLLLWLGSIIPNSYLKTFSLRLAEKAMLKGYDRIGDSYHAGKGWRWITNLINHLDIEKITTCKIAQATEYNRCLRQIISSDIFFFPIHSSDYGQLRGYPLGIHLKNAQSILQKIRQQGLLLRFELNDSIWSQKQKIVYLPMGPHLNLKNVETVCKIIKVSLEN